MIATYLFVMDYKQLHATDESSIEVSSANNDHQTINDKAESTTGNPVEQRFDIKPTPGAKCLSNTCERKIMKDETKYEAILQFLVSKKIDIDLFLLIVDSFIGTTNVYQKLIGDENLKIVPFVARLRLVGADACEEDLVKSAEKSEVNVHYRYATFGKLSSPSPMSLLMFIDIAKKIERFIDPEKLNAVVWKNKHFYQNDALILLSIRINMMLRMFNQCYGISNDTDSEQLLPVDGFEITPCLNSEDCIRYSIDRIEFKVDAEMEPFITFFTLSNTILIRFLSPKQTIDLSGIQYVASDSGELYLPLHVFPNIS